MPPPGAWVALLVNDQSLEPGSELRLSSPRSLLSAISHPFRVQEPGSSCGTPAAPQSPSARAPAKPAQQRGLDLLPPPELLLPPATVRVHTRAPEGGGALGATPFLHSIALLASCVAALFLLAMALRAAMGIKEALRQWGRDCSSPLVPSPGWSSGSSRFSQPAATGSDSSNWQTRPSVSQASEGMCALSPDNTVVSSGAVGKMSASVTYPALENGCGVKYVNDLTNVTLEGLIGQGGMSNVYRGSWAGHPVAVKVPTTLRPRTGTSPPRPRSPYDAEVGALCQLRHPCICALYGTATLPSGLGVIVLELMQGGTLFNLVHAPSRSLSSEPRGALPARMVVEIACDVASGLEHLHEHGLMHRDVKTANVLLTEEMRAKIADFGMCKDLYEDSQHTQQVGTMRYMAPEVCYPVGDDDQRDFGQEGTKFTHYDSSCDVYSFGMVLWEMLHRKIPFGDLKAIQALYYAGRLNERPKLELSPEHPPKLKQIITDCWAQVPEARPTMLEVKRQLRRIQDDLPGERFSLSQYVMQSLATLNKRGGVGVRLPRDAPLRSSQQPPSDKPAPPLRAIGGYASCPPYGQRDKRRKRPRA